MRLLDDAALAALVTATLTAVRQQYPHKLDQELRADTDLRPPRQLNPSFYGSYDWHSAVHNHWLLVRALDAGLAARLAGSVRAVLDEHLSEPRLAAELAFFAGPGGRTSEGPYGWAWLMLLHAECAAGATPQHRAWAAALAPLAGLLGGRLAGHFDGGLAFPIRSGTHGNTALSLQLTLAAARRRGDQQAAEQLAKSARRLFGADRDLPWSQPPSGGDFLDPNLTQAALLADVLPAAQFGGWLSRALPDAGAAAWTPPQFRPDGTDPRTVHLEGLLISRAWSLCAIARALPPGHPAAGPAQTATDAHLARVAGLDPTAGFGRSHWIPTFLLYLDEILQG